jgi:hypothetical protein
MQSGRRLSQPGIAGHEEKTAKPRPLGSEL